MWATCSVALPSLPALPTAAWVGFALLMAVWLGERLQRAGMARTMGYWLCGALFGIALVWAQAWLGQGVLALQPAQQPGRKGAALGAMCTQHVGYLAKPVVDI